MDSLFMFTIVAYFALWLVGIGDVVDVLSGKNRDVKAKSIITLAIVDGETPTIVMGFSWAPFLIFSIRLYTLLVTISSAIF
ncbi:hypothetical protein HAX54_047089, partial [Datura stramonium]|nr:hypothetical protein [Datura stramonium]